MDDLKLRMAKVEDAADILNIYAHYIENTIVSLETEVPSIEDMQSRMASVLNESPWVVCCCRDMIVGYAYAGRHRPRAAYRYTRELSVYIDEEFQRMGIANALYNAIVDIIKLQGYTNAIIGIALPNDKSITFHENFGFIPIGIYHQVGTKFGQFCDVGWWEMPLSDIPSETIVHFSNFPNQLSNILVKRSAQIRQPGGRLLTSFEFDQ